MEISPIMMALLLFYSFLLGMGVGLFYDANRIIRVLVGVRYSSRGVGRLACVKLPIIKKPLCGEPKSVSKFLQNSIIFFGDFASVMCATVGVIILNYSYNSGKFRFFTLLGVIVGFLLYYFSLGKLIMMISEPLAMLVKYVFLSFFILFLYPFYGILKFIVKKVAKCVFLCTFAIEKKQKKVYNIEEEVCLQELAKKGFLTFDDSGRDSPEKQRQEESSDGKKKVRRSQ